MNAPHQTSYLILLYHKIRGFFIEKLEARIIDKIQLQPLLQVIMCLIQNISFYTPFVCLSAFHFKSTWIDLAQNTENKLLSTSVSQQSFSYSIFTTFHHDSRFKNIKIFESTAPALRERLEDKHNKQMLLLRVCGKGLYIATILRRWPCVKVLGANDRLSCTSELKNTTVCYCAMTFICVSQSDSSTTCLLHKRTVHCRSSRDGGFKTQEHQIQELHRDSVMVHSTHRRSINVQASAASVWSNEWCVLAEGHTSLKGDRSEFMFLTRSHSVVVMRVIVQASYSTVLSGGNTASTGH